MRAAFTAIGLFAAVILFCAYAFLRAWSEQRHGYGKKPESKTVRAAYPPSEIQPSRPWPRRSEQEQEPRGM